MSKQATLTIETEVKDADYRPVVHHPEPPPEPVWKPQVARAEFVLSRRDSEALAILKLDPDPLQALAQVFRRADWDAGERLEIALSLAPLTPWQRRRIRKRLVRESDQRGSMFWRGLLRHDGLQVQRRTLNAAEQTERTYERQHLNIKVGGDSALFEPQLLVRAEAAERERAWALIREVETALRQWAGQNFWRRMGTGIPGYLFIPAYRLPGTRWWFDWRFGRSLHHPKRKSVVSGTEVLAMLKPPTVHCYADNVERTGGRIAPPPTVLPEYDHTPGIAPIGDVDDGRRIGVPVRSTLFAYLPGHSGFGKTELATNVFLHMVLVEGHGALFIDPQARAIQRVKEYLTERHVEDRVIEINLTSRGPQAGWNPLSMQGCGPEDVPEKLAAVVDAIAAVQGWSGQFNARALNLTLQAVQVLLELATRLPEELNPTIFQIVTLLTDESWRQAILNVLPGPLREYWDHEFPSISKDAVPPVTHMIRTMRSYPALAAILGSPRSTFDMRRAMDRGQIVLLGTGARSNQGRMLANLMVYELVRAAHTRHDVSEEWSMDHRFWAFLDELQTYDGAVSGSIADIFEGLRKFGVGAWAMNQEPERLKRDTLLSLMANRSHLITTAVTPTAANKLLNGMRETPEPKTIVNLDPYEFVADVRLGKDGGHPAPFRVRSMPVEELWRHAARPNDVPALEATMDRVFGRRPVEEAIADLNSLDQRIREAVGKVPRERKQPRPKAKVEIPPDPEEE